jgi:hypothetical protein
VNREHLTLIPDFLHLKAEQVPHRNIAALLGSPVAPRLELFLTKRTPEGIQLLVVAPVTLLVIGFLSFGASP